MRRYVTLELTELEARALARFLDFMIFFADVGPRDWSLIWRMRGLVYRDGGSVYEHLRDNPRVRGLHAALGRAYRKAMAAERRLDRAEQRNRPKT